jgi:hypothetical protein
MLRPVYMVKIFTNIIHSEVRRFGDESVSQPRILVIQHIAVALMLNSSPHVSSWIICKKRISLLQKLAWSVSRQPSLFMSCYSYRLHSKEHSHYPLYIIIAVIIIHCLKYSTLHRLIWPETQWLLVRKQIIPAESPPFPEYDLNHPKLMTRLIPLRSVFWSLFTRAQRCF